MLSTLVHKTNMKIIWIKGEFHLGHDLVSFLELTLLVHVTSLGMSNVVLIINKRIYTHTEFCLTFGMHWS